MILQWVILGNHLDFFRIPLCLNINFPSLLFSLKLKTSDPEIRPLLKGGLLWFHHVHFLLFLFFRTVPEKSALGWWLNQLFVMWVSWHGRVRQCSKGWDVHWLYGRGRPNFCLQKARMPLAGLVYLLLHSVMWLEVMLVLSAVSHDSSSLPSVSAAKLLSVLVIYWWLQTINNTIKSSATRSLDFSFSLLKIK